MPKHEDEKHEEKAAAHQQKVADRHEEKAAANIMRKLRSTIEKPPNVTKRVITKRQGITPTLLMGIT